jgi:hypothetical protein
MEAKRIRHSGRSLEKIEEKISRSISEKNDDSQN